MFHYTYGLYITHPHLGVGQPRLCRELGHSRASPMDQWTTVWWFFALPLWKIMEFVSCDDEFPNIWKFINTYKNHVPKHQPDNYHFPKKKHLGDIPYFQTHPNIILGSKTWISNVRNPTCDISGKCLFTKFHCQIYTPQKDCRMKFYDSKSIYVFRLQNKLWKNMIW